MIVYEILILLLYKKRRKYKTTGDGATHKHPQGVREISLDIPPPCDEHQQFAVVHKDDQCQEEMAYVLQVHREMQAMLSSYFC